MTDWHILTGEYPPQTGGVSDYTRLVARGLADAGDNVHVWTTPCQETSIVDSGVEVHRLPDRFGTRSLKVLDKDLNQFPTPRRILVQYVPHAFGWKALNIPFCVWLWSRRRDSVWVLFHEVVFPLSRNQSTRHNALGVGTRLMASFVVRSAEHLLISTQSWAPLVKSLGAGDRPITWLPIPSNISVVNDPVAVASLRAKYAPTNGLVLGHFGTYAANTSDLLIPALEIILLQNSNLVVLLLGRGGESVRDELIRRHSELSSRINASGELPAIELSLHLQSTDVMLQPYPDGISTRRTSAMACLQHGIPTVTTTGHLTEEFWAESGAVLLAPAGDPIYISNCVKQLNESPDARARIGQAAKTLYEERFDIRHTIAALCGDIR